MILSSSTQIWSNGFDNAIAVAFSNFFSSLPEKLQEAIEIFSTLGNVGVFLLLVGVILLFSKSTRQIGIVCLLGVALTGLFNDLILKNIFSRTRPFRDPELAKELSNLVQLADGTYVPRGILPGQNSFPSGHTFQCFAVVGTLSFLYIFDKENRKFNLAFLIFFSIYAVLMGLSRVLLSHHYMTDVIAGATIGFATGILGYYILKFTPILFDKIKGKMKKEAK